MTARKKRLGRGLDALLTKPAAAAAVIGGPLNDEGLRNIPLDLLQRGQYQPRNDMRQDSLDELADSIRSQGVVQPIVVRPLATPGAIGNSRRYEIIAGERRWRAAQLAGIEEIPAVVREVADEDAIAMSLIENIQREDLNPLEEARALDRLIREFELTHSQAADAVGRSRASVSNLLRLLELSDKVRSLLEDRELDMGHARALLAISDPARQYEAARTVIKKGLSVRNTERLVKRLLAPKHAAGGKSAEPSKSADIRRLETDVSEKLGARVRVEHTKKGSGRLVIAYNSLDELDGILKHIR